LSAQSAPHDISDLPHPLRRAVISKAVTVFDHTLVAGAEAQHEATAGDFVDRRSTRGNDPRASYEHRQNPGPEPHPACAHGEGAQQSKNLPPAPLGNPGCRKPLFLSELNALHHVQHGKRAVGLDPKREPLRGNHDRLPPRERSGSPYRSPPSSTTFRYDRLAAINPSRSVRMSQAWNRALLPSPSVPVTRSSTTTWSSPKEFRTGW